MQEGWRYLSVAEAVEQLHRHLCDFFTCELLVRRAATGAVHRYHKPAPVVPSAAARCRLTKTQKTSVLLLRARPTPVQRRSALGMQSCVSLGLHCAEHFTTSTVWRRTSAVLPAAAGQLLRLADAAAERGGGCPRLPPARGRAFGAQQTGAPIREPPFQPHEWRGAPECPCGSGWLRASSATGARPVIQALERLQDAIQTFCTRSGA